MRRAGHHSQREEGRGAMEPIQPEVMVRQVETLGTDLRTRTDLFTSRVTTLLSPAEWESIDTVILTGNGDSHHAACAAEMAFETFAEVTCEPLSAWRFLRYSPPSAAAPVKAAPWSSPHLPRAAPKESSRPSSTPRPTAHSLWP
ncbi:hypothetical protein SVIO_102310 [Streptomyces violaceusniger]|uniref:SIS domain-containing protein n=1 Tax=Streptomyces violaceusniger TaxID=68280 RepID=A0A4D4LME6_STRVO|nr:hypothetical protein SVIO_102310 [Streptomyces violaceusniger]